MIRERDLKLRYLDVPVPNPEKMEKAVLAMSADPESVVKGIFKKDPEVLKEVREQIYGDPLTGVPDDAQPLPLEVLDPLPLNPFKRVASALYSLITKAPNR